jgi:hypothetical protein
MLAKAFAIAFAVLAASFFLRNNIRYVKDIAPEVLQQPRQIVTYDPSPIQFEKDKYRYTLSPVIDYTISGLVVSKKDYRLFSIYATDSVFPYDLCLIWGGNVESGVFRNRAVRFSQDCRWCTVEWSGHIAFDLNGLSNNHLLINDPAIEATVRSLVAGDQVMIKGKLVNVKAVLYGKAGQFDAPTVEWKTSTCRTDKGAGACEIIYVEDIRILRKSNVIAAYAFTLSKLVLLALVLWWAYRRFG